MTEQSDLADYRCKLWQNGYAPIPLLGKRPPLTGWQQKIDTNEDEIRLLTRTYTYALNTGILTKFTPCIDIDLLNEEAAKAVEDLARERFEERGYFLVRIGKAPKRAILFRTNDPFPKCSLSLVAPNGDATQKIEVLADGQQVVVAGVHPETRKDYVWHGGALIDIPREQLPYISVEEAQQFLKDAAALLIAEHGYTLPERETAKATGETGDGPRADWSRLTANILAGVELHDSLRDLAASYFAAGMSDKAARRSLEALMMQTPRGLRDDRWIERLREIPRAVRSAREKFSQPEEPPVLHWHGEVAPCESRPQLVQDLIPEVGCGLISGQWGTYKTFTAFDLSHSIMSGEPFVGFDVIRRGGVLFIALEGQNEVAIRLQGVIDEKGKLAPAPFAWTETCPPLVQVDALATLCKLAAQAAAQLKTDFDLPLSLIVIDTVVAAACYTQEGADNDTATGQVIMRTLAQLARNAGCFVFAVDHFGKDASVGTRGTSAKEGAADVVFAMLGDKAITGEVTNTRLALRKRRSGANGEEFPFRARVVDMGVNSRGKRETTLVLDWGGIVAPPKTSKDDWGKGKGAKLLRRIIMSMLVDRSVDLKPWADGPMVRALKVEQVKAEFFKAHYAEGETDAAKKHAKRMAFQRAVEAAADKSTIVIREVDGVEYVWLTSAQAEMHAHGAGS